MNGTNDDNQNSAYHLLLWVCLGLLGFIVILVGTFLGEGSDQNPSLVIAKLIYGVGIAFVTAASFRTVVSFIDGFVNRRWNRKRIDIFAERRIQAGARYARENDAVRDSLSLMSFSAGSAMTDLYPGNYRLYKAFFEHPVTIRLLIMDPSSDAAVRQARTDSRKPSAGMKMISDHFATLGKLDQLYANNTNVRPKGHLEIRLMTEDPRLTIYIRDESVVIFGHYFAAFRGDEYASMKIEREWNPVVFGQYTDFFKDAWNDAKSCEIMSYHSKSGLFFNEQLFTRKMEACKQRMSALVTEENGAA